MKKNKTKKKQQKIKTVSGKVVGTLSEEEITNLHFLFSWNDIQKRVYENAKDHGWWDSERNDGELIALMHSELSEALEVLRRNPNEIDEKCPNFKNLEIELADVVIRIMDYAEARNLRLSDAILAKMAYNKTRPYKHGGKKF